MVPPKDAYPRRVPDLKRHQQCDSLQTVVPPVNIVPHEEVVGVRAGPSDAEELLEVVVLTVDVTADCYGAGDLGDVLLFMEDLLCVLAEILDAVREGRGGDMVSIIVLAVASLLLLLIIIILTLTSPSVSVPPVLKLTICESSLTKSMLLAIVTAAVLYLRVEY